MKTYLTMYNQKDHDIWENIFAAPPVDWKSIPSIPQMIDCATFFEREGVKTVIDIGCGPGVWSMFLVKRGLSTCGFDFSESAIRYAQAWASEENNTSEFVCAPITSRPFERVFDAGLATLILDNIPKDDCVIAINNLADLLNPGAVVYALFNPYLTDEMLAAFEKSNNPTKGATSISYTDSELKELFAKQFHFIEFKHNADKTRSLFLRKLSHA